MKRRSFPILLMGLTLGLLVLVLRSADLTMDPPFIGSSIGEYADAGNYLAQARSLAQTGDWKLREFSTWYASPLHNLLVLISFLLFGVGTVSSVLPSVLAGIGTVVAAIVSAAKELGMKFAFLAGALLGFDFIFLAYNRVNKQESLIAFFTMLALYGVLRAATVRGASALALLAGIAAVLTKLTGLWVLAAVIVSLWEMGVLRRSRIEIAAALFIFATVYAGILYALSASGLIAEMYSAYTVHSRTFTEVLADLAVIDQTFFSSTLLLRSPLSVIGLIGAVAFWSRSPESPPRERVLAVFALLGIAAASFYHYAPLRFRVPLIPVGIIAIIVMAAAPPRSCPAWRKWLFCYLLVSGIGFTLNWRYALGWNVWAIRVASAFALTAIPLQSIRIRTPAIAAILLLGILYQGAQIGKAAANRSHELISMYTDIARTVDGPINGEVAYWARNVALNGDIPLAVLADDPKWFLLEEETEREPFQNTHPELFKKLVVVKKYPIRLLNRTLVLYRAEP